MCARGSMGDIARVRDTGWRADAAVVRESEKGPQLDIQEDVDEAELSNKSRGGFEW